MSTPHVRRRPRALLTTTAVLGAAVLGLSACSGSSSSGGSGSSSSLKQFTWLDNTEDSSVLPVLQTLSKGACSSEQAALPLKVTKVPQANLDQQLQLLAGQDSLPAQFAAGNAPALTKQLVKSGQVLDVGAALAKLGKSDDVLPAAKSTISQLYGGFNVLPYQYNVEGIFYNKKIFADHGITPPTTYDELTAAAAELKAAGITPMAASGSQGWPITRLISNYLYRTIGPDALKDVADGKAKLTDAKYVAAAQAVADLGAKGYFGDGVATEDYDTANSQFLTGKAGMEYMGSWLLGDITNAKEDAVGADNIGFIPFPSVSGGKGSSSQLAANVGLPMTLSKKAYSAKVGKWVSCVADEYGTAALKTGAISGFKAKGDVADVPQITQDVRAKIDASTTTVLWFEALFSTKATSVSQTNAAALVTGQMSPAQFMSTVQAALGS